MKIEIAVLILTLILPVYGFSQFQSTTLIDSVLNNQLNISSLTETIDMGDETDVLPLESSSFGSFDITCDSKSEIIVQIGDSLYVYNFDLGTTEFITKEVHGISGSYGYLGGDEDKIVTAANWDSVYYFNKNSWVYSGYLGNSNSDLIHAACGNKSTYFMGAHLWYFNGNRNPKLIRNKISYSVADIAVDENENAWVLTGTNWAFSDTLRIIDSTGTSLCDIPFTEPVNTINGYGMLIRNGKVVIGFGPNNPVYPNSLVPLEVSSCGNSVSFGNPIFQNDEFRLDLAGCSKNILLPNCNIMVDLTIEIKPPKCFGDSNGKIEATVSGGADPLVYILNGTDSSSTGIFENLTEGNYSIEVIDANGCVIENTVELIEPEEVVVDLEDRVEIDRGDTAILSADILGSISYDTLIWTTQGVLYNCLNPECTEISLSPENSLWVGILLGTRNNCNDVDSVYIEVTEVKNPYSIYIPNVFSPNGDGLNDFFYIIGGEKVVQVLSLAIYDRWGTRVFEAHNINPGVESLGWDGRHRNANAPLGVYTYVTEVVLEDGEVILLKGDVTIMDH